MPPSANSLNWFCCQPESTGVFPQFYISKQLDNPTCESALYSKTHGVFGIGAAVSFLQSPSKTDEWNLFRRYLYSFIFFMHCEIFIGTLVNNISMRKLSSEL